MKSSLKILFAAGFLNAIAWIVITPLWQYPDEQAHFAQVQDTAELGFVPKQNNTSEEIAKSEIILGTSRDSSGNNKFVYHPEYKIPYSNNYSGPQEDEILNLKQSARTQMVKTESTANPPLYYSFAALFYKAAYNGSLFDRVFTVRLLSTLLFLLNIFAAYKISRIVFEKNIPLQTVLTSFVAFNPMLAFASTGILPDPLTNSFFSLTVLFCLKTVKSGLKIRYMIFLIGLTFLGLKTRQQFAIVIPLVILAVLLNLLINKSIKKLISLVVVGLSIILLIVKIFPRLLVLPEIGIPDLTLLAKSEFFSSLIWTARHTYAEVLPWYWGIYKWLSLALPHPIYQIINRLLVISTMGIAFAVFKILKNKKLRFQDIYILYLIGATVIYFLVFAIGDFYFQRQYHYSFGIQGRYYFPLIVAHMTIIVYGFWNLISILPKKFHQYFLILLILLIFVFYDFSLTFVAGFYYDLSNFPTFITQLSQYKPLYLKGNILYVFLIVPILFQLIFIFSFIKDTLNNK